jgi:Holliday junction DNA helicase RuvA
MISYLKGRIILKKEKFVILETNGVGYKVFLSQKSLNSIEEEKNLEIFCYLNVKENALELYGFLNFEEMELFEVLNNIPGVGPKIALEISSFGSLKKLKEVIDKENDNVFKGISGIGRKKTQAIILELSGKIKEMEKKEKTIDNEAEMALVNLGFNRQKVKEALSKIPQEIKDAEEKIKEALKILGK